MRLEIFKNKEFAKYFYNTSWVLVDKITKIISGLLVGAWVARYLGPDNLGSISYAQSYVFMFSPLVALGLDNVLIKIMVGDRENESLSIGTAFVLRFLSAAIVFLCLFTTAGWSVSGQSKEMVLIIGLSLFALPINVIELYFQSITRLKLVTVVSIVAQLISIIFKVLFIYYDKNVLYFVWLIFCDALVSSLLLVALYIFNGNKILSWRFNFALARKMLAEGAPLILSGLSIAMAMRLDQIMIMQVLGSQEVGIYSVGVKLAESMTFIPSAILVSIYPKMLEKDFDSNYLLHKKLFQYPLIGLLALSLVMTLMSKFIVELLFGSNYSSSAVIFSLLTWCVPLSYIGGYLNKIMVADGLTKLVFYRQIFLLAINLSLNLVLIKRFGAIGAALSTLIADLIVNLFSHYLFVRTRKFKRLFRVLA